MNFGVVRSIFLAVAALAGAFPAMAEWQAVTVPTSSEPASFPAWYRCFIRVPDEHDVAGGRADLWRDSVTLSLAGIRGPFRGLPQRPEDRRGRRSAGRAAARFKVPKGDSREGRLQRAGDPARRRRPAREGIGMPPILAGYFDELVLEGAWEVHSGEADPAELEGRGRAAADARRFTEAGFRQSSTPLSANAELDARPAPCRRRSRSRR